MPRILASTKGGGGSSAPVINLGYFGDGSDGDVTISADTTLDHDMYYHNLTINSGKKLFTAGCVVCVSGTLTNNGTITTAGSDGATGLAGGAGGAAGTWCSVDAYFGPAGAGANGSQYGTPAASTYPSPPYNLLGYNIGGKGADSTGGGCGCGATGGNSTGPTLVCAPREFKTDYYMLSAVGVVGSGGGCMGGGSWSVNVYSGGAGGGGGAGDGTYGGGGGGGAVPMWIKANTITNSATGTITAKGGNGGAGTASGSGGGGGGGGSLIFLVYTALINSGTITVAGGTGGATTGGTKAEDGGNGLCLKFNLTTGVFATTTS